MDTRASPSTDCGAVWLTGLIEASEAVAAVNIQRSFGDAPPLLKVVRKHYGTL